VTDMRDVPVSVLKWRISWDDLLALEPRIGGAGPGGRPPPGPDRLVVHRKGRPGIEETPPLAEQLRCFSTVPQVGPSHSSTLRFQSSPLCLRPAGRLAFLRRADHLLPSAAACQP